LKWDVKITFGWMLKSAFTDSSDEFWLEEEVLETGCMDTSVVESF
jgi:hypothetical protein